MSKQLNANEINERLLKVQQIWHEKLYSEVKKDYEAHAEEKGKLSCAFSFGVSKHYVEGDVKIMIVGQEANGHTCDYKKWGLEKWQRWAVAYLDYQLYNEKSDKDKFTTNSSAFWSLFRTLINIEAKSIGVCWNNIDKVRRYVQTDGIAISEDYLLEQRDEDKNKDRSDRSILHKKIFDGESLLKKEIEIAKPDMVIFAIGPTWPYYHSLSLALFDGDKVDDWLNQPGEKYPQMKKEKMVCNITEELGLDIPAFYTYHPTCLRQTKKKGVSAFDIVVSSIKEKVELLK